MAVNGENVNEPRDLPRPRLLPHVVADHALHNPEKIWGSLPKHASDASKGFEEITFARLSYAMDRAAVWLEDTLGKGNLESLAYLGPPDSRYIIFTLGSIKARYQMLYLSPRNSDEAQYHIMKQAKCRTFLCAEPMRKRIDALIRDWPNDTTEKVKGEQNSSESRIMGKDVKIYTVPDQYDLLEDTPVPAIPFEKTAEEARQDPLVILHTSSTTGMPKTIPLNQGYGFHEDILLHIPKHKSLDLITRKPFYGKCRMFVAMPLFHGGGVLLTLLKSLYHDIIAVFQPPSVPLSATVFDAIMRYGNCNGCVIPPSLLQDMIAEPSYFDTLANLDFVQFGSGPLSKASGDTLLTRQKNCPHFMGSSECGIFALLELDDPVQDWQYFYFHPWSGVEMQPINDDAKMFEMVIKKLDQGTSGLQPVFELFPDMEEWRTQDLYVQHPTKPHLWRSAGRNDDVMVLSNGEKLNPIDMEGLIANTVPAIVGALVVGQGRFMPGLLLETRGIDVADPTERAKLVEKIWPSVEKANLEAPKHAQLTRSMILFTSPDKPFARTPKLSVRRGPTVQLYADEIEEMYRNAEVDLEASIDVELPDHVNLESLETIGEFVGHLVKGLTGWKAVPGPDEDLFMLGFDSLLVLRMTRALKLVLQRDSTSSQSTDITSRTVYNSPTINDLTRAVYALANGEGQSNGEASRESKIEAMIAKYSDFNFLKQATSNSTAKAPPERWVVVLTGSTGSFGTYLLWFLLRNPIISTIYCLNRSSTARQRQIEALEMQGLSVDALQLDKRVKFLHTESLADPNLGLQDEETYRSLVRSSPTHIVHNAWPVNFNLNLTSFASHVAGVRALIDLCTSIAPTPPHFFFVSSISSGTALSVTAQVPEKMVFDPSAPSKMGYGESKYAAEHILSAATAASRGALKSTILRVGQIAGPVGWRHNPSGGTENGAAATDQVKGIWPTREWLPSLVISSQSVGALPQTLGKMDTVAWIPVDILATVVCEMLDTAKVDADRLGALAQTNGSANGTLASAMESSVYNLLNPNVISWGADLLPTVQRELQINVVVPLAEWVERVRGGPDEADATAPNPARKILGFYEAIDVQSGPRDGGNMGESEQYKTGRAGESSRVYRELGPIKKEWMASWIRQWGLV